MTVQNFKAQSEAVVVEISERSNCVKLPDTDSTLPAFGIVICWKGGHAPVTPFISSPQLITTWDGASRDSLALRRTHGYLTTVSSRLRIRCQFDWRVGIPATIAVNRNHWQCSLH